MKKNIGQEAIFKESMNRFDPSFIVPKTLWIKENEPQIFAKTKKSLSINGFIDFRNTESFDENPDWSMPHRDTLGVKPVTWKGDRSARELAGKRIRLFFELRDAHLYCFRAGKGGQPNRTLCPVVLTGPLRTMAPSVWKY